MEGLLWCAAIQVWKHWSDHYSIIHWFHFHTSLHLHRSNRKWVKGWKSTHGLWRRVSLRTWNSILLALFNSNTPYLLLPFKIMNPWRVCVRLSLCVITLLDSPTPASSRVPFLDPWAPHPLLFQLDPCLLSLHSPSFPNTLLKRHLSVAHPSPAPTPSHHWPSILTLRTPHPTTTLHTSEPSPSSLVVSSPLRKSPSLWILQTMNYYWNFVRSSPR